MHWQNPCSKKENRIFSDDTLYIAIARVVFIKWMKSRGKWGGYIRHFKECPGYYKEAWRSPEGIESFLGRCSYDYRPSYMDWINYCPELCHELNLIVQKYEPVESR
jgi:hypothetical protein